MFQRDHLERANTGRSLLSSVWRETRKFLALAVIALIVSGSLLVKVLAAAGDLDHSFSGDGRQTTNFGKNEYAQDVAIQSDGKIIVAGYIINSGGTRNDFAVARYNTNGTLDTTFSGDGKLTTDFNNGGDEAYAVAIQSDGKIVVAGFVDSTFSGFGLVRYNPDGTLDTTFSGDGKVITEFGNQASAMGLAIQLNGKIVAAGTQYSPTQDFAVARYNTDGTLDKTFSGDGKQTTDFFGSFDGASAVAIQPNGKIVVAGDSNVNGITSFALTRYYSNGNLDPSFSGDGKLRTYIGSTAGALGVAIQSNSRIVAAGYSYTDSGGADFTLMRYNGNGSFDDGSASDTTPGDSFGANGLVTTDFFSSFDGASAVVIQSDGKIVAAGVASHANNTNIDFGLARYNTDGKPDTTFSSDGKLTTGFFGSGRDEGNGLAIQSDGKLVVAGFIQSGSLYDFGLARYLGH